MSPTERRTVAACLAAATMRLERGDLKACLNWVDTAIRYLKAL